MSLVDVEMFITVFKIVNNIVYNVLKTDVNNL